MAIERTASSLWGTGVAVSVPSTVPPFRAAYGQLCHFTGIQQENRVCKAKVSFLSCGPALLAEAPGLWCYPAQKLALNTRIVKTRVSSTAGITLLRDWRGHPRQPLPHTQPLCNHFFFSGFCLVLGFCFLGFFDGGQDTRFEFLLLISTEVLCLCRWGPEAVGGAVIRLQGKVIQIHPL